MVRDTGQGVDTWDTRPRTRGVSKDEMHGPGEASERG